MAQPRIAFAPESEQERRARAQELVAFHTYAGMKSPEDPAWLRLSEHERQEFLTEARGAMRRADPAARAAAEENAAQAYASMHGWAWPSLYGYPCDPDTRELALAEARQKIRLIARTLCRAYQHYLDYGGNTPDADDAVVAAAQAQQRQDAETRRQRKPLPPLTQRILIDAGVA